MVFVFRLSFALRAPAGLRWGAGPHFFSTGLTVCVVSVPFIGVNFMSGWVDFTAHKYVAVFYAQYQLMDYLNPTL